jgi:hypothetical protein
MNPEDLLTLNALIAAGRGQRDPQSESQSSRLADALQAYGMLGASDSTGANPAGDLSWAVLNYRPQEADLATAQTTSGNGDVTADKSVGALGSAGDPQFIPVADSFGAAPVAESGQSESSSPFNAVQDGAIQDPNHSIVGPSPDPSTGDDAARPSAPLVTPVSYQAVPLALRSATGPTSTAPPRIDPSQTDVFQRGPDGKLQPIPGWHTTGPFDFDTWSHDINWGGVGRDLSEIANGALAFTDLGVTAPEFLTSLGLDDAFLAKGVKGFIDRHHADPKFMGGRPEQDTVELIQSFHRMFHQRLSAALKQAQLLPVGGVKGKGVAWGELFKNSTAARDKAIEVLRRVSRDFDIERGTSILPALEKELRIGRPELTRPPQVLPKAPPPGSAASPN